MGLRFSAEELVRARNDIPVARVIKVLGATELKVSEGKERFLCPVCSSFETSLNPRENLGRCFGCQRNFNPVDFLMHGLGLSFVAAVKRLLANQHLACLPETRLEIKNEGTS